MSNVLIFCSESAPVIVLIIPKYRWPCINVHNWLSVAFTCNSYCI